MSTIVVYQSETGFTKKYAEWIAEEFGCEAVPFKKTNATKLQGYDKVIYGVRGRHDWPLHYISI